MTIYQFGRILLVNSLLIAVVNGLFYWQTVKSLLNQGITVILIGLALYTVQLITTYLLLERQKLWLAWPFQGKRVLQALRATVIVQIVTVCLITGLTNYTQVTPVSNQVLSFLPVFILNSLPGALMEEWLFRYLPFRFGQQFGKRYQPILLCLGVLALFALIHIPAYLLQYEIGLAELGQVFMMGVFFLIVYILTQNLFFTALFHGLTNRPLYFVESPYYQICFYVSVLVVSVVWAVLNWRNQRNSLVV
jgi:membrane protease YdiL (CAAX protease family)